MSSSFPKQIEVNGQKLGGELNQRQHYDVQYWLDRGGVKALREAESLDGFDKALWHAHDEYIITNGGPVGMTLSGRKADNVLDWLSGVSEEALSRAL